jgi:hypothetical protein
MVIATNLFIDNDPGVLETQKSHLEENGYGVLTAPDAGTGIVASTPSMW